MSSKISNDRHGLGASFFALIFGGVVFLLSIQMTKFGMIQFHIDRSELSSPKMQQIERDAFAQACVNWTMEFGYRLICRKALADSYFSHNFTKFDDPQALMLLDSVISISPFEPAFYALRAKLALYTFAPSQDVMRFLRLSYLSGRSVQLLMYERFKIAYALWDLLDQTDKSIALNDFLKHKTMKRDDTYQLILSGSPHILRDILQMVQTRDRDIYNQFIQDIGQTQ